MRRGGARAVLQAVGITAALGLAGGCSLLFESGGETTCGPRWSFAFGSNGDITAAQADQARIAVDDQCDVVLCATFAGRLTLGNAVEDSFDTGTDVVVAKIRAGEPVWIRYLKGPGADTCNQVAVSNAGDIAVAVTFRNELELSPAPAPAPTWDSPLTSGALFLVFDSDGELQGDHDLQTMSDDQGNAVAFYGSRLIVGGRAGGGNEGMLFGELLPQAGPFVTMEPDGQGSSWPVADYSYNPSSLDPGFTRRIAVADDGTAGASPTIWALFDEIGDASAAIAVAAFSVEGAELGSALLWSGPKAGHEGHQIVTAAGRAFVAGQSNQGAIQASTQVGTFNGGDTPAGAVGAAELLGGGLSLPFAAGLARVQNGGEVASAGGIAALPDGRGLVVGWRHDVEGMADVEAALVSVLDPNGVELCRGEAGSPGATPAERREPMDTAVHRDGQRWFQTYHYKGDDDPETDDVRLFGSDPLPNFGGVGDIAIVSVEASDLRAAANPSQPCEIP